MNSGICPPRVALIGVTGYGAIYVKLLRERRLKGDFSLAAALVINRSLPAASEAARELESWGTRVHEDAESFFAQERGKIDLCLIPAGIAWHARLSVAALRAGMNVLVEKPLAGCLADVEAMRAAERETGRWIAVGFQDLYCNVARSLRAEVMSGALGAIRQVAGMGLWPRPLAYYERNDWAGRLRAHGTGVLDSPLNNAFAHFVALGLYFTSNRWAKGSDIQFDETELLRANEIESFDTAVVRASGGGVRYWFGYSHATRETQDPELVIEGARGRMRWVYDKGVEWQEAGKEPVRIPMPDIFAIRHEMLDAVIARLRSPLAWICDTAVAGLHTEFICKLHSSAAVREFPPELVTRGDIGSDGIGVVVEGLGQALLKAYAKRSSLASTGFEVAFRNYSEAR